MQSDDDEERRLWESLFDRSEEFGPIERGLRCDKCGVSGLKWANDNGRWRLAYSSGLLHDCAKSTPEDDFRDISTNNNMPRANRPKASTKPTRPRKPKPSA